MKGSSNHRFDRKELLQRSKQGQCLLCGSTGHQMRNCPKNNFGKKPFSSSGGKSSSKGGYSKGKSGSGPKGGKPSRKGHHGKGHKGKPSSNPKVKFGSIEATDEPQQDFWEGDVQDYTDDNAWGYDEHENDSDWHEKQVDEFLSMHSMQGIIESSVREMGEPSSDSEYGVYN